MDVTFGEIFDNYEDSDNQRKIDEMGPLTPEQLHYFMWKQKVLRDKQNNYNFRDPVTNRLRINPNMKRLPPIIIPRVFFPGDLKVDDITDPQILAKKAEELTE